MTRIAICTSVYEAGQPYLADYCAGIEAAADGRDAGVILTVDGLARPGDAFARLSRDLPVRMVPAPEGATPARVRRTMLEAARRADADVIVFADMDDRLLPDALDRHLAALARSDISFGDLEVADATGGKGGATFFHGADVPVEVADWREILNRNFFGFSNTALRRDKLSGAATAIPDAVIAADWWLFTRLLREGRRAQRTAGPVVRYRTHPSSLLGGRFDPDPAKVARRVEIARRHFASLPRETEITAWETALARLGDSLNAGERAVTRNVAAACAAPGVWFEDVFRLARPFLAANPAA